MWPERGFWKAFTAALFTLQGLPLFHVIEQPIHPRNRLDPVVLF